MKKRKFYGAKKRNQKWTEEPTGHPIDFAEKYVGGSSYSDKFDDKRPINVSVTKKKEKERRNKKLKNVLIVVLCIVLIGVGYTGMDIHMMRHYAPVKNIEINNDNNQANMADMTINISAYAIESVGFDASIMLSSVMKELSTSSYTSLMFDVKRSDGTIGYASSLASIDTFNAISSPSSQPAASVKQLIANDILPIARLCVYKDNVVPKLDSTAAIMDGDKPYTDSDGNTYLNPNSETAYNYIKDIVLECYEFGITVFVLNECNLPDSISDNYNDGFDTIAQRLIKDTNGKVKFLQEVDESISGRDSETNKITADAINNDISKFDEINDNQIFYISTKADQDLVTSQLNQNSISRYIIKD